MFNSYSQGNMNKIETIDLTCTLSDDEEYDLLLGVPDDINVAMAARRQNRPVTPPTVWRKRKQTPTEQGDREKKMVRLTSLTKDEQGFQDSPWTPKSPTILGTPVSHDLKELYQICFPMHSLSVPEGVNSPESHPVTNNEDRNDKASPEQAVRTICDTYHPSSPEHNGFMYDVLPRDSDESVSDETIDTPVASEHVDLVHPYADKSKHDCEQDNSTVQQVEDARIVPIQPVTWGENLATCLKQMFSDAMKMRLRNMNVDVKKEGSQDTSVSTAGIQNVEDRATVVDVPDSRDIPVEDDSDNVEISLILLHSSPKPRFFTLSRFLQALLILCACGASILIQNKMLTAKLASEKCPFPSLYVDDRIEDNGRDRCHIN